MHTIADIKRGLDDLKRSALNDIFPIIKEKNPEGGYFGVPRSVLSYADFLGALYGGYKGEPNAKRRRIATPEKAKQFIRDIFGDIDESYRDYGDILYEMFRHGTVHLYRPNTLINNKGKLLEWMAYKGDRKCFQKYESRVIFVHHMQPMSFHGVRHLFPISINLLYSDLVQAIDIYFDKIKADDKLVEKYSEVVDALLLPEKTDLF